MISSQYFFCFDISYDSRLDFYIPAAFIADSQSYRGYVDKKASPEVLQSFGIELSELGREFSELLAVCYELKPASVFKKFAVKSKSCKTLEDLLQDKKIKFGITLFLKSKMKLFLHGINNNNLPLSLNLGKDKDFAKCQLKFQEEQLGAKLTFEKHNEGITYTLSLTENGKMFYPSDHKVALLLDDPAWITVDDRLFKLRDINSNKLKPFLNKKCIEVPNASVPQFFEKFIRDIVRKVDIEAIGFRVEQRNEVQSCSVELTNDFFKGEYFLELIFDYDGVCFRSGEKRNSSSEIVVEDEIYVIQYKRNPGQEREFEQKFQELGLIKNATGQFGSNSEQANDNKLAVVDTIISNKEQAEKLGFLLDNLLLEGKKIQTSTAVLKVSSEQKADWFDIQMIIRCGDFEFSFTEILSNIRQNNRVYDLPDGSCFLIPVEWMAKYKSLSRHAMVEGERLLLPTNKYALLEGQQQPGELSINPAEIDYTPSKLVKATLRPYQEEGVKWLLKHYQNNMGGCLADDMGLGKTLQILAFIVAVQEQAEHLKAEAPQQTDLFGNALPTAKEFMKVLIVLPSSLVFNWYNEAKKFAPHLTRLQYVGSQRREIARKLERYDLIFTSYSVLMRDIAVFEKYNFRFLILDESQTVKNRKSETFKAINRVKASHKFSLSGTPIENSLSDLWSQMEFINPDLLGSYSFFEKNYKLPIEKNDDQDALLELKKIIQPFILRRTKEEVLKDLPEVSEQIYYCQMEPEQEKLYEEEKSKARNSILKAAGPADKLSVINTLLKLRQLSNHPKMADETSEAESGKYLEVTNYLSTLLRSGQKTIVFSSFLTNLDFYKNWCRRHRIPYCELIGSSTQQQREQEVRRFQEQETPLLFFISLKAGGVGLNITRASQVLFLDPWWNPFAEKQGIGRAHRMGQLNKVNVVRFISKNTVEEKIIQLQEKKKLLSDSLLTDDYLNDELMESLEYILE